MHRKYAPELTYAKMKNGKGISINNVVKAAIKEIFFCPCCNEIVIARQGKKNAWHFAHKSKGYCEGAFQTSLHLMAKDILQKTKIFYLPAVNTESHLLYDRINTKPIEIHKGGAINIDNVILEKRTENIIPDIIMNSGERTFLVEIFVTHKVDNEKRNRIKNLGISTIEIDLSNFDREITEEQLTPILTRNSKNKYWIWNKIAAEKTVEIAHKRFFNSANWKDQTKFLCIKSGFGFKFHNTYIATSDMDGYFVNNGHSSIYIENIMGDDIISGEETTNDGFIIYKYAEGNNNQEVAFLPYNYEYWGKDENGESILLVNENMQGFLPFKLMKYH